MTRRSLARLALFLVLAVAPAFADTGTAPPAETTPLGVLLIALVSVGGLAITAHIDRPMFILFASLGFMPPGLPVPALEIFRRTDPAVLRQSHPEIAPYPLVRDSDAHQLSQLRRGLAFEADAPAFESLAAVLSARSHHLL